jgi:hypothetical protein
MKYRDVRGDEIVKEELARRIEWIGMFWEDGKGYIDNWKESKKKYFE